MYGVCIMGCLGLEACVRGVIWLYIYGITGVHRCI